MTHINQALGQQIIDGGLRRVEDDARIYGDAAAGVLSAARVDDLLHESGGKTGADKSAAETVGKLIAERAKKAGVTEVVFDRGAYIYHGRVKALADAAREGGLNF